MNAWGKMAHTGVANARRARDSAQPDDIVGGTSRKALHGGRGRRRGRTAWKKMSMHPVFAVVDEVVREEMATLATRLCETK